MPFYKKTIPIHTSKKEKTSGQSEPNNSEDVQTNPDNNSASDNYNPNTAFRKGFSLLGKSILAGTKKVQTTFVDFNKFCGGYPLTTYPWLKKYYDKFKGDSEYAIKHIASDDGRVAVIHFKNNQVGEYNIISGNFEPRPFQWLSQTEYDYTPAKEEAKTSKDDSKQAESDDSKDIIVIYPRKTHNVRRISIRSNGNKQGSDNGDKPGSDNSAER